MAHHMTWVPESGIRQVNVRYNVDNPLFNDIERLRDLTPFKSLNIIMQEALLQGARKILEDYELTGQFNSMDTGEPLTRSSVKRKRSYLREDESDLQIKSQELPKSLELNSKNDSLTNGNFQKKSIQPTIVTNEFETNQIINSPPVKILTIENKEMDQKIDAPDEVSKPSIKFSATARKHLDSL